MSFFETIWAGQHGWVTINTKSDTGELDSERWLRWPEDSKFIEKYSDIRSSEDVYLSVAVFSEQERSNRDLNATTNVVWADADTCAPENFRVPPSVVVQTSTGRWHVWWVLDAPVAAAMAQDVAKRIAYAHKAQGCDLGWSSTKLLRVPGTSNTKTDPPFEVTATYTNRVYTLDELFEVYPEPAEVVSVSDAPVPIPLTEDECLALEPDLDLWGLADLYVSRPPEGASWSERAYRLECDMFRNGWDPRTVYSMMLRSPANKYNPDNAGQHTATGVRIPRRHNPEEVLWREVQTAWSEFSATDYVDPQPPTERPTLLTLDERELLSDNPSFVDNYVTWALSRSPQSAPEYHHSLAWMLLSTTLADRVFMELKWGRMHPNLWTIIVGDSTRTRKTTAANLFLSCVHRIESLDMGELDIGSDTTTEALVQVLGKRDGMVSLLHTDEIAGFFKENYVKNYRAGTLEQFTSIYDGTVPVVLRATKDSGNRRRARAIFNFLGVGIRSRVAEALSRDFFESGFLLRMTWAVADPPRYQRGDSDLALNEPDDVGNYDADRDELLNPIFDVRAKLPNPVAMTLAPDALERINTFAHAAHVYAQRFNDDILDAAVDRLRDSVLKSAMLLSIIYGEREIGLYSALCAIRQGEAWFASLNRMLGEVSNTEFGRRQDQVEKFVASGDNHMQSESAIYRKFTLKPQEFNEVMTALQKAGRVRRSPHAAGKWEVLS